MYMFYIFCEKNKKQNISEPQRTCQNNLKSFKKLLVRKKKKNNNNILTL